jgi:hypothetical protein
MMINSKKLLFVLALGIGLSGSVFAQKDKNRPPDKGKPPVVIPKDKQPPKEEPKTKKPDSSGELWRSEAGEDS